MDDRTVRFNLKIGNVLFPILRLETGEPTNKPYLLNSDNRNFLYSFQYYIEILVTNFAYPTNDFPVVFASFRPYLGTEKAARGGLFLCVLRFF